MSPTTLALILIIISAIAHALVGAIMKRAENKLVLRGVLGATSFVVALPIALLLPFPPAAVWAVLGLSVSIHFIYQLVQAAAFTHGDMSVVYPVMRGFAPALAALFAYLVLKETMTPLEMVGLGIVVTALIGFGWPERIKVAHAGTALALALFCGLLTAVYTVIDAYGIRLSSPDKFSFIAWFFVLEGFTISVFVSLWYRKGFKAKLRADYKGGIMAGFIGMVTYTTALYAFSLAPIAGLAALRETSVIFGAVLATFWLKEKFGFKRTMLACVLAFGLILMQIS